MPHNTDSDFLGYLRYDGEQVADGIIDANAASIALSGFDTALRYFISQENPAVAAAALPIPVRIEGGSWTAYIPADIVGWLQTALGAGITIYGATAAKKLAENDFKDIGLKTVFRNALAGLQWCIRIGKHLGDFTFRALSYVENGEPDDSVGIKNDSGEVLYVPRRFLSIYLRSPKGLLKGIAAVILEERILKIGKNEDGRVEEVVVLRSQRSIFIQDDENDTEVLFADLPHDAPVILDGLVTKANGEQDSIGFKYKNHVLTCYPRVGDIVRFKPHLFEICRIYGVIDRKDQLGGFAAFRPKIIFDDLRILDPQEPGLF